MSLARNITRWLLVPVAAAAVVIGAIVGGRWAVDLADARCAAENVIGGACVEPWQTAMVESAIYVGAIIVSLGLTLIPSAIAPKFQRTVAIIGAALPVAAIGLVYNATQWSDLLTLLVVVTLTCVIGIQWVWSRRTKNAAS